MANDTDKSTTGKPTRAEDLFPTLPADHPLFKAGYIVGIKRSTPPPSEPLPMLLAHPLASLEADPLFGAPETEP